MTFRSIRFHRIARAVFAAALTALAFSAVAHGANVGDIAIGHPYATPSLAGTGNGAAYLASIENKGSVADRLVRASTPAAARIEIHTMAVDAQGVMRMREVEGIALAPKAKVQMKPGAGLHLMLIGLKEPLKQDATFPMTLEFERAGKVEVKVIVGQPKPAGAASEGHQH